ncbi:MAG: alginate lyase family protein [Kiritimatiellia bacterium]|nr:alginate lyase family protein [Kiritimatiellia bacterium]
MNTSIKQKPLDAFDLVEIEKPRILSKAAGYLHQAPRTVTADVCDRSAGGPHDYYSEGDYWWPDPKNPAGPYVCRDGETNPELFCAHRKSMIRLSDILGTLVSAYLITGEEAYAAQAVSHLKAWFVEEETFMHPSLLYSQAIPGHCSGRGIGIIDTVHLVEVARGAQRLGASPSFPARDQSRVRAWFREYLAWLNTHEYGQAEKWYPNNHGVCWSLQAAAFADWTGDDDTLGWIRNQFKTAYVGEQMNLEGGFPAELNRTKPYGYSLFVMDAMAGVAQIASTPEDDLWTFHLPDGRGMKKAMEFIYPYIVNKNSWPLKPDVMYWDEWPVRHPCLLLAGLKFNNPAYLATWKQQRSDPKTFEVLRNLPLRHPLLWVTPEAHP